MKWTLVRRAGSQVGLGNPRGGCWPGPNNGYFMPQIEGCETLKRITCILLAKKRKYQQPYLRSSQNIYHAVSPPVNVQFSPFSFSTCTQPIWKCFILCGALALLQRLREMQKSTQYSFWRWPVAVRASFHMYVSIHVDVPTTLWSSPSPFSSPLCATCSDFTHRQTLNRQRRVPGPCNTNRFA